MSDRYYSPVMTRKPPAPSDLADKFMLRMPDGMRDKIFDAAKANNRSMNSEILDRLEKSFAAATSELAELRERNEMNERLIQNLTGLAQKRTVPEAEVLMARLDNIERRIDEHDAIIRSDYSPD